MAYGNGNLATASSVGQEVRPSATDVARELLNTALNLEGRIVDLTARIEGPAPKPVTPTDGKPDGSGALALTLARIGSVLNRCHSEMNLIEQRL